MPLTVVSTPALSNERDERRFLLGELTGLGCGMDRRAEAAGRERVALHLSLEPCQNRFGIPDRCLEKFVARAKGVEHHIAVRQQEMPVFTRHPHCVGKYGQRVGLGEIGDRIAAAALQKLVDKLVCLRGETLAQAPYHRRGQHPVQYPAGAVVHWRVGLEHQALRPPGLFFGEVGETGAAARAEGLPVVEHHVDLGIARDRPHAVARQPHGGTRLAQFLVGGKRVLEKIAAERVNIRNRRHCCLKGHDRLLAEL
jgi:hypothetical protein